MVGLSQKQVGCAGASSSVESEEVSWCSGNILLSISCSSLDGVGLTDTVRLRKTIVLEVFDQGEEMFIEEKGRE